MALDLPNSPQLDDIYQASNGINYQWDGEKWVTYVDPTSGVNVWQRDNSTNTVSTIIDGDTVVVTNNSGESTIKFDGNAGSIEAQVFSIHLLDDLP